MIYCLLCGKDVDGFLHRKETGHNTWGKDGKAILSGDETPSGDETSKSKPDQAAKRKSRKNRKN